MKRIFSILLCLMFSFSLVACGKEEKKDTTIKDVANAETSKEKEKKLEEIREEQKDDKCDLLLVDTDNVTITCKGKGKSAFGGIYITLEIVNKTDKDILVGVDKCSNDGTMADALFGETITAKMKSESDLSVMDKNLTEVKNFKGTFRVMNDSTGEMIEENIEFSIE
jgi:mannitol-specific phosphotransferase system IIBC component